MKNKKTVYLTQGAIIAALYVVLTYLANALGLANNAIQVRFSEALTVLPFFTASAIPGLTIGCLISNILTGCAVPDVIFGTMATLIGAVGTYYLRRYNKWLAPVPPIVANTIIVPFILKYVYGIIPIWLSFITVGIGEIISCGVLGMILLKSLSKRQSVVFEEEV